MQTRSGCPKGYIQHGNSCKKLNFPMIGTSLVPNVVNKLGCDHINGEWNTDYDVCIMDEVNNKNEEIRTGNTAPIKGVIVSWYMLDTSKMKDDCDDKSCGWLNAYLDITPVVRKGGNITVFDDPIYDYQLSEYTPYCYWGPEEADQLYEIIKDEALSAAKEIKDGNATEGNWMTYRTPDGRPCSPQHPDAALTDFTGEPRSLAKCDVKKPFQIRTKGHSREGDDFAKRMRKSKEDNPLMKFTTDKGEKILVDNEYIYIRDKKYIPNKDGTLRLVR